MHINKIKLTIKWAINLILKIKYYIIIILNFSYPFYNLLFSIIKILKISIKE